MTGIPLAQGRKLSELAHQFGEAAKKRVAHTGTASDETAAIRNASTQEGEAGDAARDALTRSVTTFDASKVKDYELALAAWVAEARGVKVKQDIDALVAYADAYPACHIDEMTNTVSPPVKDDHMNKDDWKAAQKKYVDVQNRMLQVVGEVEEASEEFATAIKMGTGGEIPPGIKEGSEDAQAVKRALAEGKPPPPEVLHRLGQITNLSDAEMKAWEAGKLTIPQSSMDYLNSFSRSLDGQNIQQLKDIMLNKMSEPDARNLMNGLQMIGSSKVQAPGENGMKGGFDRLPDGIRNVAKVPDAWKDASRIDFRNDPGLLRDRQDLAAIMQKGSADFMHGSDLDREVLKQTELMFGEKPHQNPMTGQLDHLVANPALQDMLAAAGRDNLAVHDLVSGVDGKTPNDKFINELLTHHYDDDGKGARALVDGIKPLAEDTSQLGASQRAGETVHAIDKYISEHSEQLSHIENPWELSASKNPFSDEGIKESFGQVNPELDKGLAIANDPYLDDMMDKNHDNTRGFTPLDSDIKIGDQNTPRTRDLLGILGTNSDAATTIHEATQRNVLEYEQNYADSMSGHGNGLPDTDAMKAAGKLQGLDDVASSMAKSLNGTLDAQHLHDIWQEKANAFDALQDAAGKALPNSSVYKDVFDAFKGMPGGTDSLKEMLIGQEPTAYSAPHVPFSSPGPAEYNLAKLLYDRGYGDTNLFGGNFPTYENFKDGGDYGNTIAKYLSGSPFEALQGFKDGYVGTRPAEPPKFGK